MSNARQDWVSYRCACGFRLERVPRDVMAQLSRCLGCGKSLRGPAALRTRAVSSVRDLK